MIMFDLITDFPIAFDSPDHLEPLGTKNDNTRNPDFVKCCERLLGKSGLILDLGCAGGGCVEDFYDQGHDAWGLEGSNYSQKHKRASWKTIPNRLHTCDISRPFLIYRDGSLLQFDIIYSFEVMEHIHPNRLQIYLTNIYNHLKPDGIFIGSFTSTKSKKHPNHHQTIMGGGEWRGYIRSMEMFELVDLKWKKHQYLRHSDLKSNCRPISFRRARHRKINSEA